MIKILFICHGIILWIKIGELNDDYIFETEEHISDDAVTHSSVKLFYINTVVIAMYGATIGKVGVLGIETTTNQACACGVSSSAIYFKYLFYYAQLEKDNFVKKGKGGAQPNISQEIIKTHEIPLPPFAEQRRIVDRIESLFAKLDEAKEKAQAVVDGFELRKSAILHKAFTGELTERWRKEHGVGLDSWTDMTIGEQAELITKGASSRWQGVEYTDDKSQTLFVTSENVREGYLDLTKEKYLSNEINNIQKCSVLNYGDVLVNIVGASIGRAAIYNLHQLANTNQAVCIVRLKPGISNEFVCTYLNSPIAQSYYCNNKVETARANVSLGSISAMHINLPTSSEQKEIVDTLNKVLGMEQQAKSAAEVIIDQIGTMKNLLMKTGKLQAQVNF